MSDLLGSALGLAPRGVASSYSSLPGLKPPILLGTSFSVSCKLQPQVRLHLSWKLQEKTPDLALASIRFPIFQLSPSLNLSLPLTCSEILAKAFSFLDLLSQISAVLCFTHIEVFFRSPTCTRGMEQAARESEPGFVLNCVHTCVYVCLCVKASETMGN